MVGVGYESGRVELRNLKTDESIMEFKHENEITAIGFRFVDHNYRKYIIIFIVVLMASH